MSEKLERRLAIIALAVFFVVFGIGYKIRMDQINERNARMAAEAQRQSEAQAQADKEKEAKEAAQAAAAQTAADKDFEEFLEKYNSDQSYAKSLVNEDKTEDKLTAVTDKESGIEIITSDKDVSDQAVIIETTEPAAPIEAAGGAPVDANTGGLPESFYESKEEAAKAIENIPAGDTVTMELPAADGGVVNIDFAKVVQVAYYPTVWDEITSDWTVSSTPIYYTVEQAKNNPIDGMVLNMGETVKIFEGEVTSEVLYTYDKFSGKWIRQVAPSMDPYSRWNPEENRWETLGWDGAWHWPNRIQLGERSDLVLGRELTQEEKEFWGDSLKGFEFGGGNDEENENGEFSSGE